MPIDRRKMKKNKQKTVEPPKVETPTPAPPIETPQPEPEEQEQVKAPETPEEKTGLCGPTVVVLISMLVLAFRRRRMSS
jgi:hypothetical protein